ncbi:MAG: hypothetical protein Q6K59_05165 [Gloeomargarita sp. GMQP_bins_25]
MVLGVEGVMVVQAGEFPQTFQEQVLAELWPINSRLEAQQQRLDKLDQDVQELNIRLKTYQKASDKLLILVSTIITGASAVIILTPLGRTLADFAATALGMG